MIKQKRIEWKHLAFNDKGEELGYIEDDLWKQLQGIRMSPGCLQEVIDMFESKSKEIYTLNFIKESDKLVRVLNYQEPLGFLAYEPVGAHMHWCWYQGLDGLPKDKLLSIREKQKELIRERRSK